MKILFLAPSLEVGGGVADYTLRLADALRAMGHQVQCVSLNEKNAGCTDDRERLSANQSWKKRINTLQGILDDFLPDMISLQFVPYGYHPKGLPMGLPDRLGSLKGAFRWHIMFHELWIGVENHYTPLQRAMGWLQRSIISKLTTLNSLVVHTSNQAYLSRLLRIGFPAKELPLFGNIPIAADPADYRVGLRLKVKPALQSQEDLWIFAFFGGIHPGWEISNLLQHLRSARLRAGKDRCLLIRLGKGGKAGEDVWKEMERMGGPDFSFYVLGEASPEIISHYLHASDFGIITTPLHLMGKSGGAATMLEHGLPLIAARVDRIVSEDLEEGILTLDQDFAIRMSQSRKLSPREKLPSVVERFLDDLSEAER